MKNELVPKTWLDHDNKEIPLRLITKNDKLRQRRAVQIYREAIAMSEELAKLKAKFVEYVSEVQEAFCAEHDVAITPAFTFYNYDKSIKIERTQNTQLKFDESLLQACKQKFDEYLAEVTNDDTAILVELVQGAFTQVKGKPDSKKLLTLLGYRKKVSHPVFQDALNLLDSSLGKGNSKYYYRVTERLDDGTNKNIILDFANI